MRTLEQRDMTKKKTKGAGGKLSRSEIIQARLSPKTRFTVELISRSEKRTVSSLIELLVDDSAQTYWTQMLDEETGGEARACTMHDAIDHIWHADESIRLVNLGLMMPHLLTPEEEKVWCLIRDTNYFWQCAKIKIVNSVGQVLGFEWKPFYVSSSLIKANLQEYWDVLQSGDVTRDALPPQNKVGKELLVTEQEPIERKIAGVQLEDFTDKDREAWLDYAMDSVKQYEKLQKRRGSKDKGRLSREYMQSILDYMIKRAKSEGESNGN